MTTLLVELFTEELPPKALAKLGRALGGSSSVNSSTSRVVIACLP